MRRKREVYIPIRGEVWLPINGADGYFVSNIGRVKSIRKVDPILIRQFITVYGYWRIGLWIGEIHKMFYVHRLVAMAFIPNPDNKPQVNHKNGIKTDNRLENLEWATPSENGLHSYKNGLSIPTKGELCGQSVITNSSALDIFNSKKTTKELMADYGVGRYTIYRIKTGKLWSHVTGKIFQPVARIPNETVLQIAFSKEPTNLLMERFGLSRGYIDNIRSGRLKSKVTGIVFTPTREPYNKSHHLVL